MMDTPVISVIVPVYNTAPYLPKCVDSLLAQDVKMLEIILVDDGSTDGSGAICDDYASVDDRIYVLHQANSGAAAARNAGLAAAAGEYIGFADSDDWVEPDTYRYLLDLALCHGADIVQCGLLFEEGSSVETRFAAAEERTVARGAGALASEDWVLFSNQIYNKLYRREILKNVHFSSDYVIGEDLLFNLDALEQASRLVFGTEAKYHYVQRQGSLCNSPPTLAALVSLRNVLQTALERFRQNDATAYGHFLAEQLRNDLDICSKFVRFRIPESGGVARTMRAELAAYLPALLRSPRFTRKEKLKFFLITRFWPIYRHGLPAWKRLMGRQ